MMFGCVELADYPGEREINHEDRMALIMEQYSKEDLADALVRAQYVTTRLEGERNYLRHRFKQLVEKLRKKNVAEGEGYYYEATFTQEDAEALKYVMSLWQ